MDRPSDRGGGTAEATMDTGVKTVTVLGAGNGGCAAAADLTRRGFSVRLSSRSEHTIRPLWERGGIEYAGALGEGFAPIPVITQAARHLLFAAFPARETERLRALVAPVFPAIRPAANILETVFRYTNAIHHPPATLCNVGRIEATAGDYSHDYEGISPSVGRIIDRLDGERTAVAAALGVTVDRFVEQFYRMGYTTAEARDSGLAYEAFHQSAPDRWIKAPASLQHRFLEEDVPFGVVPLAELGRVAGVATPTMDHLIHLASVAAGSDYRASGLTLARMGLRGVGREALDRLLAEGYQD